HHFNRVRRMLGYEYWSLSAFLKLKVKNAVQYIGKFAEALTEAARNRRLDGVVCGHIHHAEITDYGDIRYMNCGDWVESCTALVEDESGQFHLIHWADEMAAQANVATPLAVPQRLRA
ncbi:MAG TPA: UDP-2,3-diacylglucosamine diphosphatase, partial [Pseudomonadales bacterium]|nr:UDP-2,3-diacylglucosamine diphosphatase [Pseudomonadales bacterium]